MSAGVMPRTSDLRTLLAGSHLPALDGLRAIAVTVVIAYHFGYPVQAGIGVTGFFVLSGFLITWLLLKEHERTGTVSLRGFYLRRTLRIFPAYYVYIAGSFVLMLLRGIPWTPLLLGSALTYTANYYNATHDHPAGPFSHLWSLAVEEQFYLLWPMAFVFIARRGPAAIAKVLLAVIAIVFGWRLYLFHVADVGVSYVYNAFDTRFDSIAIGCLLAACAHWDWFHRGARAVASRQWYPLVTLLLLSLSQSQPESYGKGIGLTIDSVLLAVLLVQILQLNTSVLWKWLEHPLPRYIGLISYPMYLYHPWALGVGQRLQAFPPSVQLAAAMAVTIAAASGSYYIVERPALALRKRIEARARGRTAPSPARDDSAVRGVDVPPGAGLIAAATPPDLPLTAGR